MKYSYLLVLLLVGCTYQRDNYFEIQPSPQIDQKLTKLTEDMQRVNRELEELYGR